MVSNISEALRYSFEDSDSAALAREKLLQAGIAADHISTHVLSDEAGPSVGNFALDTKAVNRGNDDSLFDKIFTRGDPNEGVAHQSVRWHSSTLLLVDVDDDNEKERISALLGRPIKSI